MRSYAIFLLGFNTSLVMLSALGGLVNWPSLAAMGISVVHLTLVHVPHHGDVA